MSDKNFIEDVIRQIHHIHNACGEFRNKSHPKYEKDVSRLFEYITTLWQRACNYEEMLRVGLTADDIKNYFQGNDNIEPTMKIAGEEMPISEVKKIMSADDKPEKTRDTHVGKSDYSHNEMQPWDVWIAFGLTPWDADIIKRILRTKEEVGVSPQAARILDYQKIQHICQERIDQVNSGDPWWKNLKFPAWVDRDDRNK